MAVTLTLCLAACGSTSDDIAFAPPVPHVVLPGETIAGIAARYGLTADDVRLWNGVVAEARVGQVLHVWPAERDASLAAVVGRGRAAPAEATPRSGRSRRAAVAAPQEPVEEAAIDPLSVASIDAIWTRESGLLGAGMAAPDLSGLRLDGLTGRSAAPGQAGLGGRTGALAVAGHAEALDAQVQLRGLGAQRSDGRYVPEGAVNPPALAMPAAKRCLASGGGGDVGDYGMSGSVGLSASQVRGALAAFAPKAARCVPAGTRGSFRPVLGLKIGCDGRVASTWLADAGGLPPSVTSCMTSTLRYASFPAHDLPDGLEITWPMVIDR